MDGTAPRRLYTMRIEMNTIDLRDRRSELHRDGTRLRNGAIPLRFKRTMRPADSGEVRIFLDEKLVDFKNRCAFASTAKYASKGA